MKVLSLVLLTLVLTLPSCARRTIMVDNPQIVDEPTTSPCTQFVYDEKGDKWDFDCDGHFDLVPTYRRDTYGQIEVAEYDLNGDGKIDSSNFYIRDEDGKVRIREQDYHEDKWSSDHRTMDGRTVYTYHTNSATETETWYYGMGGTIDGSRCCTYDRQERLLHEEWDFNLDKIVDQTALCVYDIFGRMIGLEWNYHTKIRVETLPSYYHCPLHPNTHPI